MCIIYQYFKQFHFIDYFIIKRVVKILFAHLRIHLRMFPWYMMFALDEKKLCIFFGHMC